MLMGWLNNGLSSGGSVPTGLAGDVPIQAGELRPSRVVRSAENVHPLTIAGSGVAALTVAAVTLTAPIVQPPTISPAPVSLAVDTVQRSAETVHPPTVAPAGVAALSPTTVALAAPDVHAPTVAGVGNAPLNVAAVALDPPTVQAPTLVTTGAANLLITRVQLEAPTVQPPTITGSGAVSLAVATAPRSAETVHAPLLTSAGQAILLPAVVAYSGATVHAPVIEDAPSVIVPDLVTLDAPVVLSPTIASVFVPSDIANLELHFDAQDAASITESGGEVSEWANLVVAGPDIDQTTAANQPNTATVNGNDSLFFDGANEHLDNIAASGAGSPSTVAIAFTPTSVSGTQHIFSGRTSGFTTTHQIGLSNDDVLAIIGSGGPALVMNIANVLAVNETRWIILRAQNSGTSDVITDEGGSDSGTPPAGALGTIGRLSVGARDNAINDYAGHVHEVIFYNRFITDDERDDLAGYLNGRWTLS